MRQNSNIIMWVAAAILVSPLAAVVGLIAGSALFIALVILVIRFLYSLLVEKVAIVRLSLNNALTDIFNI